MTLRWMAVVVFMALPALARAEIGDLWVSDHACAREIVERKPVSVVDCKAFNLPGPVYLWVQVRGNSDALSLLEAGKDIVIRHKWVRFVGPTPEVETIDAEEEISAGTIDAALLARLRNEVAARGYFDWRTWTSKSRLRKTRYSVEILNEGFGDIPCRAPEGAEDDCALQVTIKGRQ